MNAETHARAHPGFTIMEVLVVMVIIGLLAALIFPIIGRGREQGRTAECMSNMKQIGQAIDLYLHDFDDIYPMSRFPDGTHPAGGCIKATNGQPDDSLEGSRINWKRAIEAYVKRRSAWACPSNAHQWDTGGYNGIQDFGDETNVFFPDERKWLPISYALNGSFFHEAVPPCWLGEKKVRGRFRSEIRSPANLILLLETRMNYPDLGDWWIPRRLGGRSPSHEARGPFQTHNGVCNWLFADQHVKGFRLPDTCRPNLWTDGIHSPTDGCSQLDLIAPEYR